MNQAISRLDEDIFSVLVIDDEQSIRRLLKKELEKEHRVVHTALDAGSARERLRKQRYDVIVLDMRLPDAHGLDLLIEFKDELPDVEVVMITGHGDVDSAVESMKVGAYDFISKPFHLDKLDLIIDKACQCVRLTRENRMLREGHAPGARPLVGNSAPVKTIRYLIEKVAPTSVPVLITGESGAGKDVVASAIHAASQRGQKPFVVKNCATLQKELARSELFGHVRGSFTGASTSQEGLLAFAAGGTLFLDEIGELPVEVQASLLRVLESKLYRRVGDKEERTIDIRFLFATNRDLAEEVSAGRFHEALFHRINVFQIEIPSLRERKEDIPLLAEYYLQRICQGARACRIMDGAMRCLLAYRWPGNVRELKNVIERSIILSENGLITERCLPREIVESGASQERPGFMSLENMEREHINKVLSFYDGNRSMAAEALGICRKTLYRKLQKYELS